MIFHRTHASAQVAARLLSHTTEPAWSKFFCEEMRVRMQAMCVCDCASCLLHQDMSLPFVKKTHVNLVSRDNRSTMCHATSTFAN